jgi:hypothetical protein
MGESYASRALDISNLLQTPAKQDPQGSDGLFYPSD